MSNPRTPIVKKKERKKHTLLSSLYWISEGRNRLVVPRTVNVRQREEGVGHLSFLSVLVGKGGGSEREGGLSYKLSVGGINVALLVKAGRGEGAGSMLVGVTVCSHCLSTVTSGRY